MCFVLLVGITYLRLVAKMVEESAPLLDHRHNAMYTNKQTSGPFCCLSLSGQITCTCQWVLT